MEAEQLGGIAAKHGTIGALWHQPLDGPSCSPKSLKSSTMNGCWGKSGFGEFNFQHNRQYSTPLNAKEMVLYTRLCWGLCLWQLSSKQETRREKDERWQSRTGWGEGGTARDSEWKSKKKLGNVENVSGIRSFGLTGTVWRTMLLLLECDVCPLSNSAQPHRNHTIRCQSRIFCPSWLHHIQLNVR